MKLTVVAFLALVVCVIGNAVPKKSNNGKYLVRKFTKEESKKALDYWTPERISKVIPSPIPELSHAEAVAQGIDVEAAQKLANEQVEKPILAVVPVTNSTMYPYNLMGKIITSYNDPTAGPGMTCSATYAYANNQTGQDGAQFGIVLSAGHCTYNCSAQWFFDNFVFYQQFANGKYTLRAVQNVGVLIALCDENNNVDYANDYTFAQVDAINENGTIGMEFDEKYNKFVSYGYPTNYGKGQVLESYAGGKGIIQAGKVQMPNNPMDDGSDGGPWLAPGNKAIGVNAFRVKGVQGVWSPEFDTNSTLNLLQYVISQA